MLAWHFCTRAGAMRNNAKYTQTAGNGQDPPVTSPAASSFAWQARDGRMPQVR
jgi:hypothetical protein